MNQFTHKYLHRPGRFRRTTVAVAWGLGLAFYGSPALATDPPATSVHESRDHDVATLDTLLKLAAERAPESTVAQAMVEASRSSLVGARLFPLQNPYLEILTERASSGSRELGVVGTLWLPVEISGQRGKRIDEANAWIDYHRASLSSARASAKAAALQAWGRAVVESERIRLLQEIAASAQSETEAFRTRSAAGDATERDAQLAEVEHARLTIELEAAIVARDAAHAELSRLTGRTWTISETSALVPRTNLERLSAQIAKQAPVVQASRAEASYHRNSAERSSREAISPLSVILMGGRGELGETRLGAGLGFTLPAFRRNQGERARALAEQDRSLTQAVVLSRDIAARLDKIASEWRGARRASTLLKTQALPAAQKARESTEIMFKAGKVDLLAVMVSRRDEALLRLRHLDLAEREWDLLAYWMELTGELP